MTTKTESLSPMQQELLNRADAIMRAVGDAVSKTADFAKEQVPDIAYQYVAFGRASETIYILLALALLTVGLYLLVRVGLMNSRNLPNHYGGWNEGRMLAVGVGIPISFFSFIGVLVNLKGFLLVWFAPKIWLIQEIVHLVKH